MLPKKHYTSSALKPFKALKALKALRPIKPPKVPQAWESYSQSFQATQYTHNSLAEVVIQPLEALVASEATQQAMVPTEDIKEAQPSSQIENIEDELRAIFKAHSEATKDKADEVNKTKLPELSAEVIIRIGLPTVSILQEPITTIPELDLEVINLLNKLIFAAQRAGEPISSINIDIDSGLPNQNEDNKRSTYCTLVDQVGIISSRCRFRQDLLI